MSPSIFSRGGSSEEESAKSPEVSTPAKKIPAPSLRDVAAQWRAELAEATKEEVGSYPVTRLVLSQAHPGGLAQLYAERPTRLSNLVRDAAGRASAVAAALDVIRQAQSMTERHGSVVIHLAIGEASWDQGDTRQTTPILLRPIDLRVDDEGEITLTLRPGVEISNRLLDALARRGAPLEPATLLGLVRTPQGFSPTPALDLIRQEGVVVPGLELRNTLTIGIFVHPTSALLRELGAPQSLSLSPLVRALAGEPDAQAALQVTLPEPRPTDRDPWEERGIGDQAPTTADVVEAATNEDSVFVEVPLGSDLPALVASIAAQHAAQGRKVLLVTGQRHLQREVAQVLDNQGAHGIANIVDTSAESSERVQSSLRSALLDASDEFDVDLVDDMRTRLRRTRTALASYTESLHLVSPHWGISAYDALQVLTDLTSIPGGPSTRIRLTADSLSMLSADQGQTARDLLTTASGLGVFSQHLDRHWWSGVEMTESDQVETGLAVLRHLANKSLPLARVQMTTAAEQTGLRTASTIEEWSAQLSMLEGVRDSLDVFKPAIFERSAADMVLATATKQWRKERGIVLRFSQRRRLVKQAKDLVRPGRFVDDLHQELILVQERREQWRKHCDVDGWPQLPHRIDDLLGLAKEIREDLTFLQPYLAPVYGDLFTMDIGELSHLTERLLVDEQGARALPARVQTLRQLDTLGLSDLVEDLRARQIDGDLLSLELDLTWWASALGLMLAADPRLGGFDPSTLQEALTEERRLDEEQVASLGPQARHEVLRHRKQALAANADSFARASESLALRTSAAAYYSRIPLSWDLIPIVIAAPTMVPQVVPWGRHIDVVILAGFEGLPLAELIPVVSRGRQVVVVSSNVQGSTSSASVASLSEVLPKVQVRPESLRINDGVVHLLAKYDVDSAGISIPGRRSSGRIEHLLVEGSGMPAPGVHAIESSAGEVEAVLTQILRHVAERPEDSLAVIALNERHGDRIRAAVDQAASLNPDLAAFMTVDSSEPFVVANPEDTANLRRDRIMIAVGFTKTPHGRVIHDFGAYSEPAGEQLLAQVLRCVRADLLVITSLSPEEIDESRLTQVGAKLLVDLLRLGSNAIDRLDSPWPTLELAPDNLLVDLAERLYKLGLNVVPNLGVPGGMRIPLGIGHPEVPGELLVAVLTDDDAYLAEPSQRVRDRLWLRLLEEQGWKVRTELSMAVFIDPNREAEAIVQLVLDAVDDFYATHPELRPEGTGIAYDEPVAMPEIEATEALLEEIQEALEIQVPRVHVTPRPPIAKGLPLSAYGDDQLDEVALWIISENPELDEDEIIDEMRRTLELTRRGVQSEAVLRNVARRARVISLDND